jgi:signal transduction histidine kinase
VVGGPAGWARFVLGAVLVVLGLVWAVAATGDVSQIIDGFAAGLLFVAGLTLVGGPWLLRLFRELSEERRERIRNQERAEVAAHVHDSVLQTLTLIQRNASDPQAVNRLARAEERALRGWLYRPAPTEAGTLAAALERMAGEVEDVYATTLEVVTVGDAHVDERVGATLQATREAMVNAAKHAGAAGPVAVYSEVADDLLEVFVRDRGSGFDLEDVPEDRMGVRQSIVGRMERNGGHAEIRSTEDGTEVRLTLPLGGERKNV